MNCCVNRVAKATMAGLLVAGSGLALAGNGVILSGALNHPVVESGIGTSMNMVTGQFDDDGSINPNLWDFNFWDSNGFSFYPIPSTASFVVDASGKTAVLHVGDVVGPTSTFSTSPPNSSAGWLAGADAYAGVKFPCDGRLANPVPGGFCYGFLHVTTTAPKGYPATIVDAGFDGDGNAVTIQAAAATNGIITWSDLDHAVPATGAGTLFNPITGEFDDTVSNWSAGWDFLFWPTGDSSAPTLAVDAIPNDFNVAAMFVTDDNGMVVALHPGDTIGPDSNLMGSQTLTPQWLAGADAYIGVKLPCGGTLLPHPVEGGACYGYIHVSTTSPNGFPAKVLDMTFDGDGHTITIPQVVVPNGLIHKDVGHTVQRSFNGVSLNVVSGVVNDNGPVGGDYDLNLGQSSDFQGWPISTYHAAIAVDASGKMLALHNGDVIGPGSTFKSGSVVGASSEWFAGTDAALGIRFQCDGRLANPVPGNLCYGYVRLKTLGETAYPFTIVSTDLDGDGNAITVTGIDALPDPVATTAPAQLSLSLIAGEAETAAQTLHISDAEGSQTLDYSIAFNTSADCTGQAITWLTATPATGSAGGDGISADVSISTNDTASALPLGNHPATVCVTTNDPDHALIPVPLSLAVSAGPKVAGCLADDGLFCDGFDGMPALAVPGIYTSRTAFLGDVATGYFDNGFADLPPTSGDVSEPARYYSDVASGVAYTIDSSPAPDNLWFYPGIISARNSVASLVVTFSGTPVTAVGGNFFGVDVGDPNPVILPGSHVTLTLTLADDSTRTFDFVSAGQDEFRGFTSNQPIKALSFTTPVIPFDLDHPDWDWAALDNFISGTTR